MTTYEQILGGGHRTSSDRLSPWFERRLRDQIEAGWFPSPEMVRETGEAIVDRLVRYRQDCDLSTAVVGMSGGVDSALTAAMLKAAGWSVVGVTLPINQNPEETEKGIDACEALGLEHLHLDLTEAHGHLVSAMATLDPDIDGGDDLAHRTRRGNLAARLRMSALYDQAHRHGGIVVSTDNFSERGAGFWTLHGDVGDLSPVQSLLKSWEVPFLAREYGVPERIWRSKPTDGLGIGGGDEAQIGTSYLEWDIAVFALLEAMIHQPETNLYDLLEGLGTEDDPKAAEALETVTRKIGGSWFKRMAPIEFDHPKQSRFGPFDALEVRLFRPASARSADEALVQWSSDISRLAERAVADLASRQKKLVTAESCTSGLLGAALAAAPGSSSALDGTILAYSSPLKSSLLGVSEETLQRFTPYSSEVAQEMARGALDRAPGAHVGLSVTGVGGPDADQGVPAGRIYICVARRDRDPSVTQLDLTGAPQEVLAGAIRAALLSDLS